MLFSAYQIELLLEDFQQNISPLKIFSSDTLKISEDTLKDTRQNFRASNNSTSDWITPDIINDLVEDQTAYDPIVNFVQQSRAGKFVLPEFIPENPPPPFSLVSDYKHVENKIVHKGISDPDPDKSFNNSISEKNGSSQDEELIHEDVDTKHRNNNNTVPSKQFQTDEKVVSAFSLFEEIKDDEKDEDFSLEITESNGRINYNNDVVLGEGPISDDSISKYVEDYPDSAIKFLLRKNLDGRPLPFEYEEIYKKWESRGLSRGRLKKYLFKLMQWEEFPDSSVLDILKTIREHLFDMKEKQ